MADTLIDRGYLNELLYRSPKNYNNKEIEYLWDAYTSDISTDYETREDIIDCFIFGKMPHNQVLDDFDFIIQEIKIGNSATTTSVLLEEFFYTYNEHIDELFFRLALALGEVGITTGAIQHFSFSTELLLEIGEKNNLTTAPYDVVPNVLRERKAKVIAHIDSLLEQQEIEFDGLPQSWKYTAANYGWLNSILN